jgi:hypothetical protein
MRDVSHHRDSKIPSDTPRVYPRSCWTGFGFSVSNDTGNNEIRIVHHRAEGDRKCVSELPALVDATGRFRIYMTR